jgi:hypothetical protein
MGGIGGNWPFGIPYLLRKIMPINEECFGDWILYKGYV